MQSTAYVRRDTERGHANHGWLDTRHTFSFGNYYDPEHMGFSQLRVINEDRVEPGQGFGTHGHRDMEIITYVLEGELEHRDSLGNGSVIVPGEVQRMSAGTGIKHSEFNPSKTDPVRFLQIWFEPEETDVEPSYEQRRFDPERSRNRLGLLVSKDGRDKSLGIHQDVDVYAVALSDATVTHDVGRGRSAWIQLVGGKATVNDEVLESGDGIGLSKSDADRTVALATSENAHILIFDMGPHS